MFEFVSFGHGKNAKQTSCW